jgi:hypothetical protein
MEGAHMAGSERYECSCGKKIYFSEGNKLGFTFFLDGRESKPQ